MTVEQAAKAYEAGVRSFDHWSKITGTTRINPSLFHIATWMERGMVDEFKDGWYTAREGAES